MIDSNVLVVDDEEIARQNLLHVLERDGLHVDSAVDGKQAAAMLEQQRYQLVITDLRMPGMDGLALLHLVKDRWPDTQIIVITAHASTESTVEAMRAGAFYYIEKPYRLPDVRQVVKEALEKVALRNENAELKTALSVARGQKTIVTNSPLMEQLLITAARVAPTDCNVLISGETGTGKEVMAQYLHDNSVRRSAPFIAINCGALSEELLANELFGHERGAFTGATGTKSGLLEAADGGSLFLDEVTEMALSIQVKLLRLLQEREFFRLGGTQALPTNIRIIAATNKDPAKCVADGTLRQDLYFRLNVVGLHIPPLRERRGDIPLLATHFMSKAARRMNKPVVEIDQDAFDCLLSHDFPGNVRELENLMERGVALADGPCVTLQSLPLELQDHISNPVSAEGEVDILPLAEMERRHILRALEHSKGNRGLAARLLGIDRVSLWRKLRGYRDE